MEYVYERRPEFSKNNKFIKTTTEQQGGQQKSREKRLKPQTFN